RPSVGELVSFEIESTPDGRKRAVRVMRPGGSPPARLRDPPVRATAPLARTGGAGFFRRIPAVLLLGALGMFGWEAYQRFAPPARHDAAMPTAVSLPPPPPPAPRFRCDGRRHCSEMRSYDEAKFFLDHCPGT